MDFLKLTHDSLSIDYILKEVSSEKCGAVSMFVGTTRDNFEGKKVVQLEYEAYDTMAIKVMKNICTEIRKKWSEVHHIAIYHRLGTVPVLEASVVIAISSPHRIDSIAAVKYCIENLKDDGLSFLSDNFELADQSSACEYSIDPQIIQVNASNEEIQRRIKNYIDRKRDQINLCNIQDFIVSNGENKDLQDNYDATCARVSAVLIKRKDSKGHLNVKRVQNEWGPQTKVKKMVPKESVGNSNETHLLKHGVEERLSNAETHLNIPKPVPNDIYSRLKKIEDRILELESISPEYVMFWSKNSQYNNSQDNNTISMEPSASKKFKYSAEEIKRKLEALEHQ